MEHRNLIYNQLDIGQGDSAIMGLFDKKGQSVLGVLIDGGVTTEGVGTIITALQSNRIKKVHLVILSHYDSDHLYGVCGIARCLAATLQPGKSEYNAKGYTHDTIVKIKACFEKAYFIDPGDPLQKTNLAKEYSDYFTMAGGLFGRRLVVPVGAPKSEDFVGDDVLKYLQSTIWTADPQVKFLCIARNNHYLENDTTKATKLVRRRKQDTPHYNNARSLAFLVFYGDHIIYTAGDLTRDIERELAKTLLKDKNIAVAKISHHGSRSSTPKGFITSFAPQVTLCSHGRINGHGLPHLEVVNRICEESLLLTHADSKPRRLIFTELLDSATPEAGVKALPPLISTGTENVTSSNLRKKKRNDDFLSEEKTLNKDSKESKFYLEISRTKKPKNSDTSMAKRHIESNFQFSSEKFEFTTVRDLAPPEELKKNKKLKIEVAEEKKDVSTVPISPTYHIIAIPGFQDKLDETIKDIEDVEMSTVAEISPHKLLLRATAEPVLATDSSGSISKSKNYLAHFEHDNSASQTPITTTFPRLNTASSKMLQYQKFPSLETFINFSSSFQIEKRPTGVLVVTSNMPYSFGHKTLIVNNLSLALSADKITNGSLQFGSIPLKLTPPADPTKDIQLIFTNDNSVSLEDLNLILQENSLYTSLRNFENEFYQSVMKQLPSKSGLFIELQVKPFDNDIPAELRAGFRLKARPAFTLGDTTLTLSNLTLTMNTFYERYLVEDTVVGKITKRDEYFSNARYGNISGEITLSRKGKALMGIFSLMVSAQSRVIFKISSKEDSLSLSNVLSFLNMQNEYKDLTGKLGLDSDVSLKNVITVVDFGDAPGSLEVVEVNLNVMLSSNKHSMFKFFNKNSFALQAKWNKGGEISFLCSLRKGTINFTSILDDFVKLKDLGFGKLEITEFSVETSNNLDFSISFTIEDVFDMPLLGMKFSIAKVSAAIQHSASSNSYTVGLLALIGEFACEIIFSSADQKWTFTVDVKDLNAPKELLNFFDNKEFPFTSGDFQVAKFQPHLNSFVNKPDHYFLLHETLLELTLTTSPKMTLDNLMFSTYANFSFEIPVVEALVSSDGFLEIKYDRPTKDLSFELKADPIDISRGDKNLTGGLELFLSSDSKKASITLQDVEFLHVFIPDENDYILNLPTLLKDWKLYLDKLEVHSEKNKDWGVSCELTLKKNDNSQANTIMMSFDRVTLEGVKQQLTKVAASITGEKQSEIANMFFNDHLAELFQGGSEFFNAAIIILQSSFIGFQFSVKGHINLLNLSSTLQVSLEDFSLEAVQISSMDNFKKYVSQTQNKDEEYLSNLARGQDLGKLNIILGSTIKIGSSWFLISVMVSDSKHWKIEGQNKDPINILAFLKEHEMDVPVEAEKLLQPFLKVAKVDIVIDKITDKTQSKASETLSLEVQGAVYCSLLLYKGDDDKPGVKFEVKEATTKIDDEDLRNLINLLSLEQFIFEWTSKNSAVLNLQSGIDWGVRIDLNKGWLTYIHDAIKIFNSKFDGNLSLKWDVKSKSLRTNVLSNLTLNLALLIFIIDGVEFTKESLRLSASLSIPCFKDFVMRGKVEAEYSKKDLEILFNIKGVDIRLLPGLLIQTIDATLKFSHLLPTFGATGQIGDNGTFVVSISPSPPFQFHFKLIKFVISFSSLTKVLFGSSTPECLDVVIIEPPRGQDVIELTYGGPLDISIMVGLAIFHKRILDVTIQVGSSGIHVLAVIEPIELTEWMKISEAELKLDINPLQLQNAEFSIKGKFTLLGLSVDSSISLSPSGLFLNFSEDLNLGFFEEKADFSLAITKEQFHLKASFYLKIDLGFGPIKVGKVTIPYHNILGVEVGVALEINGPKIALDFGFGFEVGGVGFEVGGVGSLHTLHLEIDFCNLVDMPWQIRNYILSQIPSILLKKTAELIKAFAKAVVKAVVCVAKKVWRFLFGWVLIRTIGPSQTQTPYQLGVEALKNKDFFSAFTHFVHSTLGEPDAIIVNDESNTSHQTITSDQLLLWINKDYPVYPERMFAFVKALESYALVNKLNSETQKEYAALSDQDKQYNDYLTGYCKVLMGLLYLEGKLAFLESVDPIAQAQALFRESLNYQSFVEADFGLVLIDSMFGKRPREFLNKIITADLVFMTFNKDSDTLPAQFNQLRERLLAGIVLYSERNINSSQLLGVKSFFSIVDLKGISQLAQMRQVRDKMNESFNINKGKQNSIDALAAFKPFVDLGFEYIPFLNQYVDVGKEANFYIAHFSTNLLSDESSEYYQKAIDASKSKQIPTFPPPYTELEYISPPLDEFDRSLYFNLAITQTMFLTTKHDDHDVSGAKFCVTCMLSAGENYQMAVRFNGKYKVAANVTDEPGFAALEALPTYSEVVKTVKLVEGHILKPNDPSIKKNPVAQKDLEFLGGAYQKLSAAFNSMQSWTPSLDWSDDPLGEALPSSSQQLLSICLDRILVILVLYGVPTFTWIYLTKYSSIREPEKQAMYNRTKTHPNSAFELACIHFNSNAKPPLQPKQAKDLAKAFLELRKSVVAIMTDSQTKTSWSFKEGALDLNLIDPDDDVSCDNLFNLLSQGQSKLQNTFKTLIVSSPEAAAFLNDLYFFIAGNKLVDSSIEIKRAAKLIGNLLKKEGKMILEQVLAENTLPPENTFNLDVQKLSTISEHPDFPISIKDLKIGKADFFAKVPLVIQYQLEIIFYGFIGKIKRCDEQASLFTVILGHLEEAKEVVPEEFMKEYAQYALESGVQAFISENLGK